MCPSMKRAASTVNRNSIIQLRELGENDGLVLRLGVVYFSRHRLLRWQRGKGGATQLKTWGSSNEDFIVLKEDVCMICHRQDSCPRSVELLHSTAARSTGVALWGYFDEGEAWSAGKALRIWMRISINFRGLLFSFFRCLFCSCSCFL